MQSRVEQPIVDNSKIYHLIDGLITFENTYIESGPDVDLRTFLKSQINRGIYLPAVNSLGGIDSPKLNQLLDAFVDALPAPSLPVAVAIDSIGVDHQVPQRPVYTPVEMRCHGCRHHHCRCDRGMDSFWLWWLILTPRTTEHHHYYHDSSSSDNNKKNDPLLMIIIILTVLALLASAIVAAIYLFGQIADMVERFAHNEGQAYAGSSLAWLALSAGGGFTAASFIVPLILAATAASNPVAWGIFGVICLGLVLTAVIHMLFPGMIVPLAQTKCEETFGSDSFLKHDFGRVQLTPDEQALLTDKGADPVKVTLAIALLRRQMGPNAVVNRYGFHAFSEKTCRTEEQEECLDKIRHLRRGEFEAAKCNGGIIRVGNMTVDMNAEGVPFVQNAYANASAPLMQQHY